MTRVAKYNKADTQKKPERGKRLVNWLLINGEKPKRSYFFRGLIVFLNLYAFMKERVIFMRHFFVEAKVFPCGWTLCSFSEAFCL